jgi:hypothetical protein
LEKERGKKFDIVGSYIPAVGKEIIPPHIEGYRYAFPLFQSKKQNTVAPVMEFKLH